MYREKVHLPAFSKRTVRAKQIFQALAGRRPPKSSTSLKILTLKPRMRLLTAKPPKLALTNFSCLVSKTNTTSGELRNRRLAKLLNTRRSQQQKGKLIKIKWMCINHIRRRFLSNKVLTLSLIRRSDPRMSKITCRLKNQRQLLRGMLAIYIVCRARKMKVIWTLSMPELTTRRGSAVLVARLSLKRANDLSSRRLAAEVESIWARIL